MFVGQRYNWKKIAKLLYRSLTEEKVNKNE